MTKDTQPHPDQGPAMKSNDHPNLPDWAQAIGNPSADVDMLHKQALADIKERGETPAALLGSLAGMMATLRAKVASPGAKPAVIITAVACTTPQRPSEALAKALFFDESVAAGTPTPGDSPDGRPAAMSDVFGPIGLAGKIFARVSGWSMIDSAIKDGDIVLVDPHVEVRDGDIVLASVSGLGQVVKRLRLANGETAILESANPNFKPIIITDPDSLCIHGKVLWRAGNL